ncbi:hypothetical protein PYW07_005971 [Mythimna separata]|uniref:Malate dehydrogenase n=1 Tax=Mythimna separata TaxID=271217 RepID=A0AAD7YJU6_MYTSE|nr:hypothetical protein PYW07_005971 [Mythimna separata]
MAVPIRARVCWKEVIRFATDCLVSVGSPRKAAEQVADLLVEADKIGHRSHGLNRIGRYIRDIKTGRCCPNNKPEVIKETVSTAWGNSNNVLGATSAHFGADIAIKKAKQTGIGWVCMKGSNHYGIGGYWATKISNAGLIGMTFTNGSPLVAPTRGTKAALGSNPIAVSAPGLPSTGPFYLDIATATVALGKIEMCRRKGIKLAHGWAVGPDGKETLDPDLVMKSGSLMPLGGGETTAGYKGFGLSALVDIFSGLMAGANYAHHVPRWTRTGRVAANIGQTFVAIDHKSFTPDFEERISDCIKYWRQMKPSEPGKPVLAPGDLEKVSSAEVKKTGTVSYIVNTLNNCDIIAKDLKVKPIERCKE